MRSSHSTWNSNIRKSPCRTWNSLCTGHACSTCRHVLPNKCLLYYKPCSRVFFRSWSERGVKIEWRTLKACEWSRDALKPDCYFRSGQLKVEYRCLKRHTTLASHFCQFAYIIKLEILEISHWIECRIYGNNLFKNYYYYYCITIVITVSYTVNYYREIKKKVSLLKKLGSTGQSSLSNQTNKLLINENFFMH